MPPAGAGEALPGANDYVAWETQACRSAPAAAGGTTDGGGGGGGGHVAAGGGWSGGAVSGAGALAVSYPLVAARSPPSHSAGW
eukprot:COSAG01_NODE_37732_length_499_cov_1.525000_1_plen_82_part_01